MKISGFTFLRNASLLGYPFIQSIKSILPICDEFVIALGASSDDRDDTAEQLAALAACEPKIRIVPTQWNEKMQTKGYVYGQQKSIAHFNCTGDWAFYLEGDEVVHERDLPEIVAALNRYQDDERVEAFAFNYLHFYGNPHTYAQSPAWYRRAPRIIRNTLRSYSPDGLFFLVLDTNKRARYPRAKVLDATIYHYGWVRPEQQTKLKVQQVGKYWGQAGEKVVATIDYAAIDAEILRLFEGAHPAVMQTWFAQFDASLMTPQLFAANPQHVLTARERRHRWLVRLEKLLGMDLTHKHFTEVA